MKEFLIVRDACKWKETADPTRQKILEFLRTREMSADELAMILRKDVSTIYRHIHRLEAAGLVEVAREERAGAVTRKYYRRVAKLLIGVLPTEKASDNEILSKTLYEGMEKGLQALRGFKFSIPEDKAALDKLTEIAVEWYKQWNDSFNARITEEKMVGDLAAYEKALKLLALVETRENPQLRRATELLVSKLTKHRESI